MSMKTVLKQHESDNVVFDFKPRQFPLVVSPSASQFVSGMSGEAPTDFQINPLAAEQAGVAQLQRDALNDRIEEEALKQLKTVEEKAYKEAYELGLVEGRDLAFKEHNQKIEANLKHFDDLLSQFENMKSLLGADHEAHIVRMIFEIASRIAMREIAAQRDSILPVVTQVISESQADERLVIHLSAEDLTFIEEVRSRTGKTAELLKRVKLEVNDGIRSGGCSLESNYGSIDATIETRTQRAWQNLSERLPRAEQRSDTIKSDEDSGES